MSKQSDHKILRIGLIQNGKIVEERLMRSRSDVRVGQDFKKNDLVVPVSDLPKSFPVFEVKGDRYVLNFTPKMSGRVSAAGEVKSLQDFRKAGKAKKGKDGYTIPLSPNSRGRVQIGEVTLLFQFVTPPPKRPQPVLPASMRGGWIKGMDRALVSVIAVSALIQVGFVVWVENQDWPQPKDLSQRIPDRFVEIEKEKEPPKPKKKIKTKAIKGKTKEKKAKKEDSKPKKKKKKKKMSPEEQAKKEAEKQRQMAKEVKNKTIIGQLGHISKDGGTVADVLSEGVGKKSMDDAFANSEGVTAGSGAEKSGLQTSGSSDASGSGKAAGIGDLGKTEGAKKAQKGVKTGQKKEQKVQARVNLKTPERTAGTGNLDSSSIRSVIKRYSSRIQRCYERQLKVNSKAAGKVVVNFTIGRAGRVTQSKSITDSVGGGVGSCVARVIQGLRFPRPKGGEVMVNKTFVFEAGG